MSIRNALPALFFLLISSSSWAATEIVDPGLVEGESTFGRFNNAVLDSSGNPVAVFSDPDSVYLVHCNDAVCGGGDDTARKIASQASSPSVTVDSSDFPVITYFDDSANELELVHCNDTVCRDDNEVTSTLAATGNSGDFNDIVLDSSGYPIIAFEDGGNDDLRLIHCNDVSCQGGDDTGELVDNLTSSVGAISLTLDVSGSPVIAYAGDFNLKLAHCNDSDCNGGDESVETIDTDGNTGQSTTLVLDSSGDPVIGYARSGTDGTVKLAHCNDPDCDPAVNGAESIAEVVTSGTQPAMTLDSAGRPGFSYIESGLQFVQCNDVDCVGGDEITSTLSASNYETSIARDSSNNPVIFSFISAFQFTGLKVTSCNDTLCLGSDETVNTITDIKLDVGTYMSFARQGSDFLYAYRDETNAALRFRRCDDLACGDSGDTLEVVDDTVDAGRFADLALDPGGLPFIAYYDADNGNLKIADCSDDACSSTTQISVDGAGDVGQYPDTVFDSSGLPVISYYDGDNGALKLAHCVNASCASLSNTINTVDDGSGNSVGIYSAIALDASGFPVIAYHDETAGSLKLAHCNDVDCDPTINGAPSIEVVDTGTSLGQFTDIQLDGSGSPVISYHDAASGYLKLAHCNDGNCAGGDQSIETVDTGGGQLPVGEYTSLDVDNSGNPVISYYKLITNDLRVAQCNDPNCAGPDDNLLDAETTGDVGQYSSLVVEGTTALVAYYDQSEQAAAVTELTLPSFLDFGDAPTAAQSGFASDYPTELPDGARHEDSGITLGSTRDTETDGQPTASADGDDANGTDDEEGVSFDVSPATGTTTTVTVNVSAAGKLDAWIDFKADGDWADTGEQVFASEPLSAGKNVLSLTTPAEAQEEGTFARFRVSAAGGLAPTGAASDGEVEDYRVTVIDGDTDDDGMTDAFENAHEGLDPNDPNDADDDEDEDSLDNLGEFNAGTDPNDPDSDGDGIGDALDDDPAVNSNECAEDTSGDATFDGGVPANTTLQCAASNSITVEPMATIDATGGRLELISPTVTFVSGFSVPEGAKLDVEASDPTPP